MIKRELLKLDIFMFETQTTELNSVGNDLSPEMKTYYTDRLIDNAEPKLVHDQFADKYPIPKGGGKTIEFRKYDSLPKALTPLTEGVTPNGNKLNVTAITATVSQFGDFIVLSDMLQTTAIDKNVVVSGKLLASQAGRTLDTVTRDVLVGGTNVAYAPKVSGGTATPVTSRYGLDATAVLTPDLVVRSATFLEGYNADTIDDSFVAIVHPDVAYDIMRNEEWIDSHKYATPENIYNGELGKIGNVRFVKSTEAKVWRGADLSAGSRTFTVKTAISSAADTIAVDEVITAADATALVGRKVLIGGVQYEVESASAAAAGSATITLTETLTVAADVVIYPGEGGAAGISVYSTIVLGAHAYATTEIEGMGLEHIVKQLGQGEDRLNQRSSVGWKATKVTKRLVEQYMIRLESASGFRTTTPAN